MKRFFWGVLYVLWICGTYAQNRVEGHLGVVHPCLTISKEGTRSILDQYVVGFPMGISARKNDRFAFDAEFVPFIIEGKMSNLLIHPGLLWGLNQHYTLATRAAFEWNGVWGVTPSITRGFKVGQQSMYIDFALPMRWKAGQGFSQTFAVHVGFGF
ncbi:MAG: hypothetical protein ACK4GN_04755 [Runella sp.]